MNSSVGKSVSLLTMVLVLLLPVPEQLNASGEKVVVFLQNRSVVIGELLSVREHELVLSTNLGWSDEELSRNPGPIFRMPIENILEVKVKKPSYVATGAGVGSIAGLLVGIGVEASLPKDGLVGRALAHPGEAVAIVGGSALAGGLLGALVGMTISNGDVVAVTSGRRDFESLKQFARYPTTEPEFLRSIGQ